MKTVVVSALGALFYFCTLAQAHQPELTQKKFFEALQSYSVMDVEVEPGGYPFLILPVSEMSFVYLTERSSPAWIQAQGTQKEHGTVFHFKIPEGEDESSIFTHSFGFATSGESLGRSWMRWESFEDEQGREWVKSISFPRARTLSRTAFDQQFREIEDPTKLTQREAIEMLGRAFLGRMKYWVSLEEAHADIRDFISESPTSSFQDASSPRDVEMNLKEERKRLQKAIRNVRSLEDFGNARLQDLKQARLQWLEKQLEYVNSISPGAFYQQMHF